jgi:hypothetical protein
MKKAFLPFFTASVPVGLLLCLGQVLKAQSAGCMPRSENPRTDETLTTLGRKLEMNDLRSSFGATISFDLLSRLSWNTPEGVPSVLIGAPQIGLPPEDGTFSDEVIRSDVRIKITHNRDIIMFCPDYSIRILDSSGSVVGSLSLPKSSYGQQRQLVDFASDRNRNVYLLERTTEGKHRQNSLSKFDGQGTLVWQTKGAYHAENLDPTSLEGHYSGLILYGEDILVHGTDQKRTVVLKIAHQNGSLVPIHEIRRYTESVYYDSKGMLYFYGFLPEKFAAYWVQYDPRTEEEILYAASQDVQGSIPAGADTQGRVYSRLAQTLVCLDRDSIRWTLNISNIVVDTATHDIYLTHAARTNVGLEVFAKKMNDLSANEIVLRLPDDLVKRERIVRGKLVSVDNCTFHVTCYLETGGRRFCEFDCSGALSKFAPMDPDEQASTNFYTRNDFKLQFPETWGIGPEGVLYLPIHGPDGLYIGRISFNP